MCSFDDSAVVLCAGLDDVVDVPPLVVDSHGMDGPEHKLRYLFDGGFFFSLSLFPSIFKFPASRVNGNPQTRDSIGDGFFVLSLFPVSYTLTSVTTCVQ